MSIDREDMMYLAFFQMLFWRDLRRTHCTEHALVYALRGLLSARVVCQDLIPQWWRLHKAQRGRSYWTRGKEVA